MPNNKLSGGRKKQAGFKPMLFLYILLPLLALFVSVMPADLLPATLLQLSPTHSVEKATGQFSLPPLFVKNEGAQKNEAQYKTLLSDVEVSFYNNRVVYGIPGDSLAGEEKVFLQHFPLTTQTALSVSAQSRVNAPVSRINQQKESQKTQAYNRLVYKNVYEGIDLVYTTETGQLKYEYIVAPGVNPDQIKMQYQQLTPQNQMIVSTLEITSEGKLKVKTPGNPLFEQKPVVYQTINNEKVFVESVFKIQNNNSYGFFLGEYNPDYPLVIDPVTYSTLLGGSADGEDVQSLASRFGHKMAVNPSTGIVYLTGRTQSTDFPQASRVPTGGIPAGASSQFDAFVAAIDPSKTGADALEYVALIGGVQQDEGRAIEVNTNGEAFVFIATSSTDFPLPTGITPTLGGNNAVVVQLSSDGTSIINTPAFFDAKPSNLASGQNSAINQYSPIDIDLDDSQERLGLLLSYRTSSAATSGDYEHQVSGNIVYAGCTGQAFGTDYTLFQMINLAPGNGVNPVDFEGCVPTGMQAEAIELYTSPSAPYNFPQQMYLTGSVTANFQVPFQFSNQVYGPVFNGGLTDGVIARFSTEISGTNGLNILSLLGGTGEDVFYDIELDENGVPYVVGATSSDTFPVKNRAGQVVGFQPNSGGQKDAVIAALTATTTPGIFSGGDLFLGSFYGGAGDDVATSIYKTPSGDLVIAGFTDSENLPLRSPLSASPLGGVDGFVARIEGVGTSQLNLKNSTYFGGAGNDYILGVVADDTKAFVSGITTSSNDFSLPSAIQSSVSGPNDAFVSVFPFQTSTTNLSANTPFSLQIPAANTSFTADVATPFSTASADLSLDIAVASDTLLQEDNNPSQADSLNLLELELSALSQDLTIKQVDVDLFSFRVGVVEKIQLIDSSGVELAVVQGPFTTPVNQLSLFPSTLTLPSGSQQKFNLVATYSNVGYKASLQLVVTDVLYTDIQGNALGPLTGRFSGSVFYEVNAGFAQSRLLSLQYQGCQSPQQTLDVTVARVLNNADLGYQETLLSTPVTCAKLPLQLDNLSYREAPGGSPGGYTVGVYDRQTQQLSQEIFSVLENPSQTVTDLAQANNTNLLTLKLPSSLSASDKINIVKITPGTPQQITGQHVLHLDSGIPNQVYVESALYEVQVLEAGTVSTLQVDFTQNTTGTADFTTTPPVFISGGTPPPQPPVFNGKVVKVNKTLFVGGSSDVDIVQEVVSNTALKTNGENQLLAVSLEPLVDVQARALDIDILAFGGITSTDITVRINGPFLNKEIKLTEPLIPNEATSINIPLGPIDFDRGEVYKLTVFASSLSALQSGDALKANLVFIDALNLDTGAQLALPSVSTPFLVGGSPQYETSLVSDESRSITLLGVENQCFSGREIAVTVSQNADSQAFSGFNQLVYSGQIPCQEFPLRIENIEPTFPVDPSVSPTMPNAYQVSLIDLDSGRVSEENFNALPSTLSPTLTSSNAILSLLMPLTAPNAEVEITRFAQSQNTGGVSGPTEAFYRFNGISSSLDIALPAGMYSVRVSTSTASDTKAFDNSVSLDDVTLDFSSLGGSNPVPPTPPTPPTPPSGSLIRVYVDVVCSAGSKVYGVSRIVNQTAPASLPLSDCSSGQFEDIVSVSPNTVIDINYLFVNDLGETREVNFSQLTPTVTVTGLLDFTQLDPSAANKELLSVEYPQLPAPNPFVELNVLSDQMNVVLPVVNLSANPFKLQLPTGNYKVTLKQGLIVNPEQQTVDIVSGSSATLSFTNFSPDANQVKVDVSGRGNPLQSSQINIFGSHLNTGQSNNAKCLTQTTGEVYCYFADRGQTNLLVQSVVTDSFNSNLNLFKDVRGSLNVNSQADLQIDLSLRADRRNFYTDFVQTLPQAQVGGTNLTDFIQYLVTIGL